MGAGTRVTLAYMASASGDFVAAVGEFLPSLTLSHSAGFRIRTLAVIARPPTDNGHYTTLHFLPLYWPVAFGIALTPTPIASCVCLASFAPLTPHDAHQCHTATFVCLYSPCIGTS